MRLSRSQWEESFEVFKRSSKMMSKWRAELELENNLPPSAKIRSRELACLKPEAAADALSPCDWLLRCCTWIGCCAAGFIRI